jgi:hypothetical protein
MGFRHSFRQFSSGYLPQILAGKWFAKGIILIKASRLHRCLQQAAAYRQALSCHFVPFVVESTEN